MSINNTSPSQPQASYVSGNTTQSPQYPTGNYAVPPQGQGIDTSLPQAQQATLQGTDRVVLSNPQTGFDSLQQSPASSQQPSQPSQFPQPPQPTQSDQLIGHEGPDSADMHHNASNNGDWSHGSGG